MPIILSAAIVGFFIIFIKSKMYFIFYHGDTSDFQNKFYLLSSIIQSLASILAIVISITLVAVQLSAQTYSPQVIKIFKKKPYFKIVIITHLITIILSIFVLSLFRKIILFPRLNLFIMGLIVLMSTFSFIYLVIYTFKIINILEPVNIAKEILKEKDFDALEELFQKMINEGLSTEIISCGNLIGDEIELKLKNKEFENAIFEQVSNLMLFVGRRAIRNREADSLVIIFNLLSSYVNKSNIHLSREVSKKFNSKLYLLYFYLIENEQLVSIQDRILILASLSKLIFEMISSDFYEKEDNIINCIKIKFKLIELSASKEIKAKCYLKLGELFRKMSDIRDDKQNLRKAIYFTESALRYFNLNDYPYEYLEAKFNLGVIFKKIAQCNDPLKNLLKARQLVSEAYIIGKKLRLKDEYLTSMNTLGNIYLDLANFNKDNNNLIEARLLFEEAIKLEKRNADSIRLLIGMGNVYLLIFQFNKTDEDYKKGIEYYKLVLNKSKETANPFLYHFGLVCLSHAYSLHAEIKRDASECLLTIKTISEILINFNKSQFPIFYGKVLMELCELLLSFPEACSNWDNLVQMIKEAQTIFPNKTNPLQYADLQLKLGKCYLLMAIRAKSVLIKEKEELGKQFLLLSQTQLLEAIELFIANNCSYDLATAKMTLAFNLLLVNFQKNIHMIYLLLSEATRFFTRDKFPEEHANCLVCYGQILLFKGDDDGSKELFERAKKIFININKQNEIERINKLIEGLKGIRGQVE